MSRSSYSKLGFVVATSLLAASARGGTPDVRLLEVETRPLRTLVDEVRPTAGAGTNLESVQEAVLLEDFEDFFTGGRRAEIPAYRRAERAAVGRAFSEFHGEIP